LGIPFSKIIARKYTGMKDRRKNKKQQKKENSKNNKFKYLFSDLHISIEFKISLSCNVVFIKI